MNEFWNERQLLLGGAFLKGQEDYHKGRWTPGFWGRDWELSSQYASGYAYELNMTMREIVIGGRIWRLASKVV